MQESSTSRNSTVGNGYRFPSAIALERMHQSMNLGCPPRIGKDQPVNCWAIAVCEVHLLLRAAPGGTGKDRRSKHEERDHFISRCGGDGS